MAFVVTALIPLVAVVQPPPLLRLPNSSHYLQVSCAPQLLSYMAQVSFTSPSSLVFFSPTPFLTDTACYTLTVYYRGSLCAGALMALSAHMAAYFRSFVGPLLWPQ